MAGPSVGQNGQNIQQGDYIKIPANQLGISPGVSAQFTDYIGVCLVSGGPNISGVYLVSSGGTLPFSGVAANQCMQLGQAAGPGNAGNLVGQN